MPPRHRAIVMLLVALVVWGSTFVVTKEVVEQVPPLTLALLRVAIGALTLLPVVLVRRRAANAGAALPWGTIVAMAFIGVALYYALFNLALFYTTASQGALVQSCIPAVTALIAMLWLGERADAVRWLGIGLSIAGVLVVFSVASGPGPAPLGEAATDPAYAGAAASEIVLGNLMMFAAVVCWASYTSLARRVGHCDPVLVTASLFAIGALMLLPLAMLEMTSQGVARLDAGAWLGVLYLGTIASGAAYMFYNAALVHMEAGEVGVYTNLIPIVGVITGVVVLGESLSMRSIVGGTLVFAGIVLTGMSSARSLPRAFPRWGRR